MFCSFISIDADVYHLLGRAIGVVVGVESFKSTAVEEYANEILPFGSDVGFTDGAGRITVSFRCWNGIFRVEYSCLSRRASVFAEEFELQWLISLSV